MRFLTLLLLLVLTSPSYGETNLNARVANLSQDVIALAEDFGQIKLAYEELERQNTQLKLSVKSMESTIQELKSSQSDTLNIISQQIDNLSIRTQSALDSLNTNLNKRKQVTYEFSDDYPKTGIPYTVQFGDSISVIAQKFHSTTQYIKDANRIGDPRMLKAGQKIFIPQPNTAPPVNSNEK